MNSCDLIHLPVDCFHGFPNILDDVAAAGPHTSAPTWYLLTLISLKKVMQLVVVVILFTKGGMMWNRKVENVCSGKEIST